MIRAVSIFSLGLLAVTISACSPPPAPSHDTASAQQIDLNEHGESAATMSVSMHPGEVLVVHAHRAGGTPYAWTMSMEPKNVVTLTNQHQERDGTPPVGMVGTPESDVFELDALSKGDVNITVRLARIADAQTPGAAEAPVAVRKISVTVN